MVTLYCIILGKDPSKVGKMAGRGIARQNARMGKELEKFPTEMRNFRGNEEFEGNCYIVDNVDYKFILATDT